MAYDDDKDKRMNNGGYFFDLDNDKDKEETLIWLTVVKEKTVSLPLFEFEKDCIGYCSRA